MLVDSDAGLNREIGLLDDRETREQSYLNEFQNSYRGDGFSLLGGLGHFSSQVDEFAEFRSPDLDPLQTATDLRHDNIYVYSQIRYRQALQATLGVSVDFLESAQTVDLDPGLRFMRNRVNPKVGLIWTPLPDTTVRLAAFRVVQKTLPSNQTLEPTQVAGFNQFFDDPRGVVAWRYGVGLDQHFALDLYAGAELSSRDLKLVDPVTSISGERSPDLSWQELLGRAYLYWAPHPWWALSAEYYYERLNRERNSLEGFESVTTQRVPLGIAFIHPSGLALRFNSTVVRQEGVFGSGRPGTSGEDRFVVVGTSLSYRLPKRYGILAISVENLLDSRFKFQETDATEPLIESERQILGTIVLAF